MLHVYYLPCIIYEQVTHSLYNCLKYLSDLIFNFAKYFIPTKIINLFVNVQRVYITVVSLLTDPRMKNGL